MYFLLRGQQHWLSIEWYFSQGRIFYTIILSMIKLYIMSEYTVAQIGCLDGSFPQ